MHKKIRHIFHVSLSPGPGSHYIISKPSTTAARDPPVLMVVAEDEALALAPASELLAEFPLSGAVAGDCEAAMVSAAFAAGVAVGVAVEVAVEVADAAATVVVVGWGLSAGTACANAELERAAGAGAGGGGAGAGGGGAGLGGAGYA